MQSWKPACLPWKTVTLLKSLNMVCCLPTKDNCSDFLHWHYNSWTSLEIDFKLHFSFGSWLKDCWYLQDGATAHTANSTVQVLSSSLVVTLFLETSDCPGTPGLMPLDFCFGTFFKRMCTKQPAYIKRIETKCFHNKRHCRKAQNFYFNVT
jgi:hypothetical protein